MKFLAEPVKPMSISQYFGENKACVDDNRKVIQCDGLNPPPGFRSLYGPLGHTGIDIRTAHGQPVYNSCDGTVSAIDTNPKSGLDVRVESIRGERRFRHIYEHLQGYQVKIGDKVKTGHLLGWANNSGYSSGDHLHWELQEWLVDKWVPVDPMPYTDPIFALDVLGIENKLEKIKEQVALLLESMVERLRKR